MAYGVALILHSGLRWLVLALGGGLLVWAVRVWRAGEDAAPALDPLRRAFLGVLDMQMLLGLLLYFVWSPLSREGLSDLGVAMRDGPLRFYAIEHPFGMLVAIIVAHAGLARAWRLDSSRQARAVALTMAVWLVLVLASIPWPGLEYGRPLLRLS